MPGGRTDHAEAAFVPHGQDRGLRLVAVEQQADPGPDRVGRLLHGRGRGQRGPRLPQDLCPGERPAQRGRDIREA